MENTFLRALARSITSAARQCQPRVPVFRLMRAFSSTPQTFDSELDQVLSPRSRSSTDDDSPISALSKNIRGPKHSVSGDYSDMARTLQQDMLRRHDNSPPHRLHVYSHRHNTVLCLTRPNGNPLVSMSAGNIGFRKGSRGGYDAAYQLTTHVFAQIQERGLLMNIKKIEIVYRGFHQGREAFTKVLLQNEGKNIRSLVCQVADSTRIKFGGDRSRKVRRLG
ncbi:hypothetical protein BDV12DRAFT_169803 [Aspergillus spectabilis]